MKYINSVQKVNIFNGGYVELYDFSRSNDNEQAKIETVSIISNSVFGQNGKIINAQKLYNRIMQEAALNTPGRPFQFVPVVIKVSKFMKINPFKDFEFYKYGSFVIKKHRFFCTNLRNYLKYNRKEQILQIDKDYENIYSNFRVFKLKVPMFVRDQLMTHTSLSKINQSNRVGKNENMEFYFPSDLKTRLYKIFSVQPKYSAFALQIKKTPQSKVFDKYLKNTTIISGQNRLKSMGYPKELYSRFPNQLKYGIMWIAGWNTDPNAWHNLFLQRNAIQSQWKNWTQHETHQYVEIMKSLIDKYYM